MVVPSAGPGRCRAGRSTQVMTLRPGRIHRGGAIRRGLRFRVPIDTPVPGGVLMRVMRPMRRLAAMRRASVAVALGLLLTVAACATAAPDGHGPAAASRDHHRPAATKDGSHVAALAAAAQAAEAGAGRAALPMAPAHQGSAAASSGAGPAYFHTLPPGEALPSGAQCARWGRARPIAQNKGGNRRYTQTTRQPGRPGGPARDQ